MNFEEHAAKPLLARAGIAVPDGRLVTTAAAAGEAARELGAVVVKAQAPTGKRGKAGGIRPADTPAEAEDAAAADARKAATDESFHSLSTDDDDSFASKSKARAEASTRGHFAAHTQAAFGIVSRLHAHFHRAQTRRLELVPHHRGARGQGRRRT